MLRSLFSGISGLRQHQTMMDVVSNNIANVNTTGFKGSTVLFEDTLSQMMRAAAAPGAGVGGLNPAQVGLGVQLGGIQTNFGQGSAQTTNKATDLMIQGDGFFVLKDGNEQVYSRSGAFTLDTEGYLINSDGMYVQGYPVDANGVINPYGQLGNVRLQAGSTMRSSPTTTITIGGNIPAGDTSTLTLSQNAYDTRGDAHALSIVLTWNSTNSNYDVAVTDANTGNTTTVPAAPELTFLGTGSVDTANSDTTITMTIDDAGTVATTDDVVVTIDLSTLTNYSGVTSVGVKEADGSAAGTLQQFQIAPNGTVIGIFSNGEKMNLAQLGLANFNNPSGLEKLGDTTYRTTPNSGIAQVGVPASGGRGQLQSGTLEMSNVDLGAEFTNLIIAQRGFQANSRVITSADEMLQDLVNIKR